MNLAPKQNCAILVMLLALTMNTSGAASELDSPSSACSDGFKALRDGDAVKALQVFNAACRERPDSVEAHFGRARALAQLGRKEEATKEFKLVLLLNPASELKAAAQDQLNSLKPKGEGAKQKRKEPVSAGTNTVRPQDVEGSISKMLKQSEERINSIQSSSESYANSVFNARSDAHSKAMEMAQQEAEEMRRMKVRFGRRFIPAFSEADIRQRQAELMYKSASALDRAKADYENRKQEAETRSMGVKASVEGLESQMINKPSETSGVFLLPAGTNLYVRNYGHFDPVMPEAPEPLHAVPLKMPQLLKAAEEAQKKGDSSKKNSPAKSSLN